MLFSRLLHCDHGQILSCIRFSCTEWVPYPPDPTAPASTSLPKGRNELTDSLDIDTPFPDPEPWPSRSGSGCPPCQTSLCSPSPCRRPPSPPPPSRRVSGLLLPLSCLLCLCQDPSCPPPPHPPTGSGAFCLSFLPFRDLSQARHEYIRLQGFREAATLPS